MASAGMPSGVRETQAALAARGVMTYEPSLSAAVYDALYSYWRLPRGERAALESELQTTVRTGDATEDKRGLAIRVDWSRWLRFVDANCAGCGVRPTEAAWAFALLVDCAVIPTEGSRLELLDWKTSLFEASETLTNGGALGSIVSMLTEENGDYYMAFLVGVTVLERALYDLHEQHSSGTDKSSSSSGRDGGGRSSTMILRLLLESLTMKRVLPPGMLRMLEILFLPSALNLRNLVWHGFVIPAEFPRCFGCLVVLLTLELLPLFEKSASRAAGDTRLFNLSDYDRRFILRCASPELETVEAILGEVQREQLSDLIDGWVIRSGFIPRGRTRLVQTAFSRLHHDDDELSFLFAILPVFEHALRLEFLRANRSRWPMSDEYGKAQIDQYYSTLDGFGQRDKHQVLLHPEVIVDSSTIASDISAAFGMTGTSSMDSLSDERGPNALYEQLPSGALAVLLDLFMMHGGPNIRAKLCHGEADLSSLWLHRDGEVKSLSTVTQMLLTAFITICDNRCRLSHVQSRTPPSRPQQTTVLRRPLVSSFHPFYRIYRELQACYSTICDFDALRVECTRFSHEDVVNDSTGEALTCLVFGAKSTAAQGVDNWFTLIEKTARVSALLDGSESAPKKTLPFLLAATKQRLQKVEEQLREHFSKHHTSVNDGQTLFLGIASAERGSGNSSEFRLMRGDIETDPDTVRRLLALSDGDGLSVTACVLDILTSIQRSQRSFRERIDQLRDLIVSGTARTNHRRSFINSVFFLPVLEHVLLVCLSIVEHHVVHLFQVAICQRAPDGVVRGRCSRAAAFERLQGKQLQFITAFEGCTGSAAAAQKSTEKALELALQFFGSKAVNIAIGL
jgi:hypothetical protein